MGRKGGSVASVIEDLNPDFLFEGYPLTVYRSPKHQFVELPDEWLKATPGPSISRMPALPGAHDLVHQHDGEPIGQRIILYGRVLDRDGNPVPGALLELWQTNAAGRYSDEADPRIMPLDPNFTGWGRCVTGPDGTYRFHTVRPVPYQGERGGRYRPAHIHVSIIGPDLSSRLITQCYFPDDPFIQTDHVVGAVSDPRGVHCLIGQFKGVAKEPNGLDASASYEWDIVIRGRAPAASGSSDSRARPAVLTTSQTIGPLYGFALMFEGCEDSSEGGTDGSLRISGRVIDGAGEPVVYPGIMLELWEGSQFVRARTDREGRFEATVRKPEGQTLTSGQAMAPHFKVTVFGQGLLRQVQTLMYFDGEEANAADPILQAVPVERRGTLMARERSERDWVFDIHLQGSDETVFFAI